MTDTNTPASGGAKPPAGFYADEAGRQRWFDGDGWTDHYQSAEPDAPSSRAEPERKKKRIFLWFFMAVQVLFIVWIIAGASSSGGDATDCGSLSQQACNDAEDIGTGLGVALIVVFWMIVDFLLAVVYGIYRLAKRN
ncbi:DUF2510 domain-containing protein [Aeromicrobium sp. UC242_57]|uniref:DUF2510 domain-containing protein n=1 Tax=Aeromicrobium sp. UC242_57 TaxID=3374624 RepID=UPI0037B7758F